MGDWIEMSIMFDLGTVVHNVDPLRSENAYAKGAGFRCLGTTNLSTAKCNTLTDPSANSFV
jgi:hypothetical protein